MGEENPPLPRLLTGMATRALFVSGGLAAPANTCIFICSHPLSAGGTGQTGATWACKQKTEGQHSPPQNSGASWPQPLITVENTNAAHVEADSDFQALTLDVVFEVTLV